MEIHFPYEEDTVLAYRNLVSMEIVDVQADIERKSVQLESASSGYRTRYVTVEIESSTDLDSLIEARTQARDYLKCCQPKRMP
jgi:hypothetical protein